eukprot:jgi/Mesvir1/8813/Mv02714-RA.1
MHPELGSIFGEPLTGGLMDSLPSSAPVPPPSAQTLPQQSQVQERGTQWDTAAWGKPAGSHDPASAWLDSSMGAGVAALVPPASVTAVSHSSTGTGISHASAELLQGGGSSMVPGSLGGAAASEGMSGGAQGQRSPGLTQPQLTHVDHTGRATMVDVGGKVPTRRVAVASGQVLLGPEAYALVEANKIAKGDVLTVAQIAGIGGAKATASLIPLCHPLPLSSVKVRLSLSRETRGVSIEARVATTGPTGVEMEALTAVSVAALAVYDMCKAVSKGIQITDIRLESKTGGKSGDWFREQGTAVVAGGVGGVVGDGYVAPAGEEDLRSEDSWTPQFGHAK